MDHFTLGVFVVLLVVVGAAVLVIVGAAVYSVWPR